MGLISGAFSKLFIFLWALVTSFVDWLRETFEDLFKLVWDAIKWIGNLLRDLFYALFDILIAFFEVIYSLIKGLLYLIYCIGLLAVKLFQVIFEAAKLLWALVKGFGNTLASLSYTPTSGSGHGYSTMLGKLFNALNVLQLDVIAYILLFALWFITAISAIKLISSIRVGGS